MLYWSALVYFPGALLCQGTWLHYSLVALGASSVMYHGRKPLEYRGKTIVAVVDKTLARWIYIRTLYNAIQLPHNALSTGYLMVYWFGAVYIVAAWFGGYCHLPEPWGNAFHAAMHLFSTTGVVGLAYAGDVLGRPLAAL
jgi:hypothetical protein